MKRSLGILCGLVFASLSAPVQAQDYYGTDGGLYWGVRGGLSQVRNLAIWVWGGYDPTYDNSTTPPTLTAPGLQDHLELRSLEMDYGFVAGASIGYTLAYPKSIADLRFEAEGIYRRHDDGQINSAWQAVSNRPDSVSLGYETVPVSGSLELRSAMINALVDIHTQTRFTPYLGVGAGVSQMIASGFTLDVNRSIHGVPFPQFFDETIYALSWQAIAGVGYRLSPGIMVTAETRYFRLATDRWSDLFQTDELRDVKFDDWSLGLRFTF